MRATFIQMCVFYDKALGQISLLYGRGQVKINAGYEQIRERERESKGSRVREVECCAKRGHGIGHKYFLW
jgi:hypothetical protein